MTRLLQPDLGIDFALSKRSQQQADSVKKAQLDNMVKGINVSMCAHKVIVSPAQTGIKYAPDPGHLKIDHEDGKHVTHLSLSVEDGIYSITPCTSETIKDQDNSAMSDVELGHVYGRTDDLNILSGALDYILALHYPTAAKDGRLQKIVDNYKYINGLQEREDSNGLRNEVSVG